MAPKKRANPKTRSTRKRQKCGIDQPTTLASLNQDDAVQAKPSPFFLVLPRELRDQIYHEVWRQKTPFLIDFERGEYQFKVCYDDAEEPPGYSARPRGASRWWEDEEEEEEEPEIEAQPSWILTNRQILEEALAQFHHRLSWTFVGRVRYEQFISPKIRLKENLPSFISPSMARQSHYFLLRPWDAHTLILPKISISMYTQLMGSARGAENFWTIDSQLLKWLKTWRVSPPKTKRLVLKTTANTSSVETAIPTNIDFTPLNNMYLHYVNYIEISVGVSGRAAKLDFVQSKLRPKLSEIGLALLGGNGETFFEASGPPYPVPAYSVQNVTWRLKLCKSLKS